MNFGVTRISLAIGFSVVLVCLVPYTPSIADAPDAFTLIYAGEEGGQLGLHGCGTEQVGGLSRRQTVIHSLREVHAAALNLHAGNILDPADPNSELICQIALEALSVMNYDALCLGPGDLCLPLDSLSALYANHPDLPVICTNIVVGARFPRPFEVVEAAKRKVAVVGLISNSYETEISAYNPGVAITRPMEALETLGEVITRQSDIVVGVFHGSEAEARELAERFSWLSVLVLAKNETSESASATPIVVGNTTIVSNPAKGEAVGVLEIGLDAVRQQVVSRKNQRVTVSEGVVPDADLETLLALYDSLYEEDEFDGQELVLDDRAVHITYFHKRGCQKCARANEILKRLKTEYPQIVVEKRDAKTDQQLLEAMGALFNVPEVKRLTSPAVFIGDAYLLDELDESQLEEIIGTYLATGVASRISEAKAKTGEAESEIVKRFSAFGTLAVAGAGLLDGINPCAFATIVFFISYLSLVGRSRREMLVAGGAFAAAVFVTYLLLGMGLLKFLSFLNEFSVVAKCVYLVAAIGTFTLAFLSIYDAIKAKQGKVKEITLQLPKSLKQRIHKVIREQTRTSSVIIGALVIGFAISALELVCTGQVYLPTITFVMGVEGMRVNALAYLILYNMMFITPLLIVFCFVYWGTTSMQLGGVLQRHLMPVKVGTGVLLLGLGFWLLLRTV
ncbi:MAG: hypothetical protein OXP71_07615 [Candidatus Poribacteria bacterium]|nr:hypothetical protein [Candidatus Poribacteria bacterium]